jgi:hypothetical protein
VCAAAVVLATIAACTDFEAPEVVPLPDVVVGDPSFADDIQPIFTARCATASCHNLATQQVGLNLQEGYAYGAIVGVVTPTSREFSLIEPFDPDNSWLVRMIQPDPALRFDHPRMPLGRDPLTANQIATIVNWVTKGAAQN